jgi:hypothetical protein
VLSAEHSELRLQCRRKAEQHPILGCVAAIRFLAPPLLGENKSSKAWRDLQQQQEEVLGHFKDKITVLQQLIQDCSAAASSLPLAAAAAAAAAVPDNVGPVPADTASSAGAIAPGARAAEGAAPAAAAAGAAPGLDMGNSAAGGALLLLEAAAATGAAAAATADMAVDERPEGVGAVGVGAGAAAADDTPADLVAQIEARLQARINDSKVSQDTCTSQGQPSVWLFLSPTPIYTCSPQTQLQCTLQT